MLVVVAVGTAQVVACVVLWAETLCFGLVSMDRSGMSRLGCALKRVSKDLSRDRVGW